MKKNLLILSGILGILAVVLGAFGAHALETRLDADQLSTYKTGVQYHFYHLLAIMACLALSEGKKAGVWLHRAGWLFVLGIVLFSGSVYILACKDLLGVAAWTKVIGPITPIGGTFFILGWACVLVHGTRQLK
jgi:uncharacterized membrane protein YgdD (TMEM256/DUF423 family)